MDVDKETFNAAIPDDFREYQAASNYTLDTPRTIGEDRGDTDFDDWEDWVTNPELEEADEEERISGDLQLRHTDRSLMLQRTSTAEEKSWKEYQESRPSHGSTRSRRLRKRNHKFESYKNATSYQDRYAEWVQEQEVDPYRTLGQVLRGEYSVFDKNNPFHRRQETLLDPSQVEYRAGTGYRPSVTFNKGTVGLCADNGKEQPVTSRPAVSSQGTHPLSDPV